MNATSGPTSETQFAIYDPDSHSWKMWPAIGLWGSIPFSETWPRTGRMCGGRAYELPISVPPTTGNGSSSSLHLPTPTVMDMGRGHTPETWDEWTEKMRSSHRNGNGHGRSLEIEAQKMLPTPTASEWKREDNPSQARRKSPGLTTVSVHFPTPNAGDSRGANNPEKRRAGGTPGELGGCGGAPIEWGAYAPAVRRWERVVGPAPAPTEINRNGKPRLNPAFAEWMMGLPPGHVTDVPGVSRAEQLKAIGNGVCPQQGAAALVELLDLAHHQELSNYQPPPGRTAPRP